MSKSSTETEVRFLEIDKAALVSKLVALGAVDKGERMLEEVIVYDKELKWRDGKQLIRLRKDGDRTQLTYKLHDSLQKGESVEIETDVGDLDKAIELLEAIGFPAYRRQQKKRHTLTLNGVTFDMDTWPRLPTYVELEGESLDQLKKAAATVGLDWSKVVFKDARRVIEEDYGIPVGHMRWFTFDRLE